MLLLRKKEYQDRIDPSDFLVERIIRHPSLRTV